MSKADVGKTDIVRLLAGQTTSDGDQTWMGYVMDDMLKMKERGTWMFGASRGQSRSQQRKSECGVAVLQITGFLRAVNRDPPLHGDRCHFVQKKAAQRIGRPP